VWLFIQRRSLKNKSFNTGRLRLNPLNLNLYSLRSPPNEERKPMDKQDFEKYADVKQFNSDINPVWDRVFTRFLQNRQQQPDQLKALDYGCGDGKHLPRFEHHGLPRDNIFGNEVSAKRVQRCHDSGWKNVVHVPLNNTVPFADNQFDVVNLMEVIEHIPAAKTDFYLKDMRRIMKNDGILFVSTPNYPVKRFNDFFEVVVNRKWKRILDDPTHVTFYTAKSLEQRLRKHFDHVAVICYKNGIFYPRINHPAAMHKIIAVASPSPIPAILLEGETNALPRKAA
jgi:2-polyprenyl-3-methyl-5-hydroxy-6-metoxy-1,4-benzoquinol methylase